EEAGIFLGMAKALNRIALHLPHCTRIKVRPDGFSTVFCLSLHKLIGDLIKRCFPRYLLPCALTFCALALLRKQQAVWAIDTLRIARHFGADHTISICVIR